MAPSKSSGRIRVGIGGWIYAPWRGTFYPKGLKQADELAYAASHLTSIEINATHYRLQSPKSFRKWADAAPDGFMFSVKGPRLVTQQKVLAETGGFIKRFLASGLAELGPKLGPVLWQFAPFKPFDRDDFARFLTLAGFVSEAAQARADPYWDRGWPHRMTLSWLWAAVMGSDHDLADLAALECPVLLTKGTRSAEVDRTIVDVLGAHLRNSTLAEFEGTHAHHLEDMDSWLAALRQNLSRA